MILHRLTKVNLLTSHSNKAQSYKTFFLVNFVVKGCLDYGENRSKLVHFKEQKLCFESLKTPSLEQFSPLCKQALS